VFSQKNSLTNLLSFSTTRLILLLLLSNRVDNFSNSGVTNAQLYDASVLAGVVTPGKLNSFTPPYSVSLSLSFCKSITLNHFFFRDS
jgi:hypothetical protein